jgi:hypothetical protein
VGFLAIERWCKAPLSVALGFAHSPGAKGFSWKPFVRDADRDGYMTADIFFSFTFDI